MVSRIDSVIGERTERRRATAVARVDPLLRDLRLDGFDLAVIGSLARREFKSHSDVDFLIRGRLDAQGRAKVERAVAAAMRGSGISYDLIYAADLTPERLEEFERDLDRAGQELGKIGSYLDSIRDSDRPVNEWARGSALALGVHNIYNGIEDVMLNLANDIDGYVPTGESAHQDLLDQMSAAIDGKRPALLSSELYGLLVELKGFRHIVRHRYGFDLDLSKVEENLATVRTAFPRSSKPWPLWSD
jgi:predicted nucleotidyltransferase